MCLDIFLSSTSIFCFIQYPSIVDDLVNTCFQSAPICSFLYKIRMSPKQQFSMPQECDSSIHDGLEHKTSINVLGIYSSA
ncbi:hypothetical protein VNO77_14795 [Canavalia gladiata]|uniref:Uncharacterized protein n=1 Tax=Canavalia gladiata TaxID=3824 RepID=A0AAN9QS43_CANGL